MYAEITSLDILTAIGPSERIGDTIDTTHEAREEENGHAYMGCDACCRLCRGGSYWVLIVLGDNLVKLIDSTSMRHTAYCAIPCSCCDDKLPAQLPPNPILG